MQRYTCSSCAFTFSEAEKVWDAAIDSGRCPKCREPLHDFPVPVQKARHITKQPYEWGIVISWVLFAFLLGFVGNATQMQSRTLSDRSASSVLAGIMFAVIFALIVGSIKYWDRNPNPNFSVFGSPLNTHNTDKAVFYFSVGLAIFFLIWAFVLKRYGAVTDALVCGLLGIGVKRGSAPSRWILAVYAFIIPIAVILLGGSGMWIWPFLFLAVCKSIVAHQKESHSAPANFEASRNTSQVAGMSDIDAAYEKIGQEVETNTLDRATWTRTQGDTVAKVSEEDMYAAALAEVQSGATRPGLWAKAFADSEGDENKSKALYIKLRVQQERESQQQEQKAAEAVAAEPARRKAAEFTAALTAVIDQLRLKGYEVKRTAAGWSVSEPLGGRVKFDSDKTFLEYAQRHVAVAPELYKGLRTH